MYEQEEKHSKVSVSCWFLIAMNLEILYIWKQSSLGIYFIALFCMRAAVSHVGLLLQTK